MDKEDLLELISRIDKSGETQKIETSDDIYPNHNEVSSIYEPQLGKTTIFRSSSIESPDESVPKIPDCDYKESEDLDKKLERLNRHFDLLEISSRRPLATRKDSIQNNRNHRNNNEVRVNDSDDSNDIFSTDEENCVSSRDGNERVSEFSENLKLSSVNQPKNNDLKDDEKSDIRKKTSKYACAYCGINNYHSIIKCVYPSCRKWFCNYRKQKDRGSHIIQHLVLSRHKRVRLHKKSCLKGAVLDCYMCDSDNVFDLGFVAAKSGDVVLLLCRSCVSVYVHSKSDTKWDSLHWLPLIRDRIFIPWLVKLPTASDIARSNKITLGQIKDLEELWSSGSLEATIMDVINPKTSLLEDLKHVTLSYSNGFEYYSVFMPLIQIEEEHDRKLKEAQTQENVAIKWEYIGGNISHARFCLPSLEQGDTRLAIGDELKIKYTGELISEGKWVTIGNVIKVPNNFSDEIILQVKKDTSVIAEIEKNYTIEFIWRSTSYDRMKNAVMKMAYDSGSLSTHVLNCVLGKSVPEEDNDIELPKKLSAPGLPELNPSQMHAVREALKKRFSIIQGPPGTGKTVTSATIIYHISKICGKGILVAAPSNVAVNNLCETIARTGLNTVRITAKSREAINSPIDHLSLHKKVKLGVVDDMLRVEEVVINKYGKRSTVNKHWFNRRKKFHESSILENADVICCTCVTAGDPRIKKLKFNSVLIDEATQATEPECLIPLIMSKKMAIIVGDHKQLGPVVFSKMAVKAGFQQSLFERLVHLMKRPIRLQVQYRMHPCLSEFPSNMFYEGSLQNGISSQQRLSKQLNFPWPNPETPMLFHCSYGSEELSPSGTSYINRTEATYVEKIVTWFLKAGIKPQQIGIVTPYEGQRSFLAKWMQQRGTLMKDLYKEIETSSVDSFQGREMDYIILTCVRSNNHNGIGFLSDPRRLNVALTRAKYGLAILGNPKVLSKHPLWCNLILHFKEKCCLVVGPLNNLKPAVVEFTWGSSKSRKPPTRYLPYNNSVNKDRPRNNSAAAVAKSPDDGTNTSSMRRNSLQTYGSDLTRNEKDSCIDSSLSTPSSHNDAPSSPDIFSKSRLSTLEKEPKLDKKDDTNSQLLLSMSQDNFLNFGYKSQVELNTYNWN